MALSSAHAANIGWADRTMPWLDSFGTGDARIDDEHRCLIESCNALCAMAARGAAWPHAAVAAAELLAIVESHFASEEALFPVIRFPHSGDHRREHETIRRTLASLLRPTPTTDLRVAAATARMILVEHMLRYDLGFKTFVQESFGA